MVNYSIITRVFLGLLISATYSFAVSTTISPNIVKVDEGVDFTLGNDASSDFIFTWTDPGASSPSFSNVSDPTLVLTIGETYTFQRSSSLHPFVIMDNTAATFISGSDGSYSRTTTSGTDIDNATLKPIADFTADPAPTTDLINWTPSAQGDFWFTCRVTSHTGMSGKISVVPEPASTGLIFGGVALIALVGRRR